MFLLSVHPPHQIKAPALLRSVQQLLINLEQAPAPSVSVIGDSTAPTMAYYFKTKKLD